MEGSLRPCGLRKANINLLRKDLPSLQKTGQPFSGRSLQVYTKRGNQEEAQSNRILEFMRLLLASVFVALFGEGRSRCLSEEMKGIAQPSKRQLLQEEIVRMSDRLLVLCEKIGSLCDEVGRIEDEIYYLCDSLGFQFRVSDLIELHGSGVIPWQYPSKLSTLCDHMKVLTSEMRDLSSFGGIGLSSFCEKMGQIDGKFGRIYGEFNQVNGEIGRIGKRVGEMSNIGPDEEKFLRDAGRRFFIEKEQLDSGKPGNRKKIFQLAIITDLMQSLIPSWGGYIR